MADENPETPVVETPRKRKSRRRAGARRPELVTGPLAEPAKDARGPWLSVPGWRSFCHYGARKAPWVKIQVAWLRDYRFLRLADHQRLVLMSLWVLAAELDNHLPADAELLQWKLGLSSPVDLRGLVEAGFLELHGARLEQILGVQVAPGRPIVTASPHVSLPPPSPLAQRPQASRADQGLVWPPPEADSAAEAENLLDNWERSQPI